MKRGIILSSLALSLALCALSGCGSDGNANADGSVLDGDGSVFDFGDADPTAADAGANTGCVSNGTACNNCIDDDNDGFIDGFDPECTGSADDDEGSFATGIPGDNKDAVNQDCFFDGDSGGGNDGCNIHVCCLLDLMGGDCPAEFKPGQFDPNDCTVSDRCSNNCGALTPPGCDCFSCCTLCDDDSCVDVLTNPAVAPDCDLASIDDPAKCPPCNKIADCGTSCDPNGCVLCPGQTAEDLPPECTAAECPSGLTVCTVNTDCQSDEYCSQGCCIRRID